MKKISVVCFVFVCLLITSKSASAAFNDATLTTAVIISVGGYELTVSGSSAVIESMIVSSNNFSVTLGSGSSITVTSATKNRLSTDVTSDVVSNICSGTESSLSLAYTGSGTITNIITPSSEVCVGSSNGGSSSGSRGGGSSNGSVKLVTAMASTTITSIPAINNPNASIPAFLRDLSIGSAGPDVKALQIFLNTHGFVISSIGIGSPGNEGEYFGEKTRQAVARLQMANNISPAVGRVGPMTRALIARLLGVSAATPAPATTITASSTPSGAAFVRDLSLGSSGDDVRALQKYLNTHGFIIASSGAGSPGNETNTFGSLTKQALIKFQISKGLPGTGFFGPRSRAAIGDN